MPHIDREHVTIAARLGAALTIGAVGGAIFWYFNMPLAWMLGSMAACGLGAILRLPIGTPSFIRPPMAAVIGTMLGSSFHTDIFSHLGQWIIPLLGMVAFLICAGVTCFAYFKKAVGLDDVTAYFSAMPGGLIDMVILGSERGGDERAIALIHSARIFLVVMIFPPIIQWITGADLGGRSAAYIPLSTISPMDIFWFLLAAIGGLHLGKVLHLPAYFMIGPMLASAALHLSGLTDFVLPSIAVATAQVVLGATIGCRFIGTAPKRILQILAVSAGSVVILVLLAMGFAELIALFSDVPPEGLMLAYAPGGLAEMSLVAFSIGVEVPLVVAHHMARVFLVISGASLFFNWRAKRSRNLKS